MVSDRSWLGMMMPSAPKVKLRSHGGGLCSVLDFAVGCATVLASVEGARRAREERPEKL